MQTLRFSTSAPGAAVGDQRAHSASAPQLPLVEQLLVNIDEFEETQKARRTQTLSPEKRLHQKFQRAIEQQMVEKVSFRTINPHYYSTLPYFPGLRNFLLLLKRSRGHPVRIPIPDTIVFCDGKMFLMRNDSQGNVVREPLLDHWKQDFVDVCTSGLSPAEQGTVPCAVLRMTDTSETGCFLSRPILSGDLTRVLSERYDLALIQRYIRSGSSPCAFFRVLWRGCESTCGYRITNRSYRAPKYPEGSPEAAASVVQNPKDSESFLERKWMVHLSQSDSFVVDRVSSVEAADPFSSTLEIVRLIEGHSVPGLLYRLENLTCDFIHSSDRKWYFIGVKTFRVMNDTLKKAKELEQTMLVASPSPGYALQSDSAFLEHAPKTALTDRNIFGKLCGLCGVRFHPKEIDQHSREFPTPFWNDITYQMSLDMMEVIKLKNLRPFAFHHFMKAPGNSQYHSLQCCPSCYQIYHQAMRLLKVSRALHELIQSPTPKLIHMDAEAFTQSEKIPMANENYRVLIAFHSIMELSPELQPQLPTQAGPAFIQYQLGQGVFRVPIDWKKAVQNYKLPIKYLHIHYLLSSKDSFLRYLRSSVCSLSYNGGNSPAAPRGEGRIHWSRFLLGGRKSFSKQLTTFFIPFPLKSCTLYLRVLTAAFLPLQCLIGIIRDKDEGIPPGISLFPTENCYHYPLSYFNSRSIPEIWFEELDSGDKSRIVIPKTPSHQFETRRATLKRRCSQIIPDADFDCSVRSVHETSLVSHESLSLLMELVRYLCLEYLLPDSEMIIVDEFLVALRNYNSLRGWDNPKVRKTFFGLADIIEIYQYENPDWSFTLIIKILTIMSEHGVNTAILRHPIKVREMSRLEYYKKIWEELDHTLSTSLQIGELFVLMSHWPFFLRGKLMKHLVQEYQKYPLLTISWPDFVVYCECTFYEFAADSPFPSTPINTLVDLPPVAFDQLLNEQSTEEDFNGLNLPSFESANSDHSEEERELQRIRSWNRLQNIIRSTLPTPTEAKRTSLISRQTPKHCNRKSASPQHPGSRLATPTNAGRANACSTPGSKRKSITEAYIRGAIQRIQRLEDSYLDSTGNHTADFKHRSSLSMLSRSRRDSLEVGSSEERTQKSSDETSPKGTPDDDDIETSRVVEEVERMEKDLALPGVEEIERLAHSKSMLMFLRWRGGRGVRDMLLKGADPCFVEKSAPRNSALHLAVIAVRLYRILLSQNLPEVTALLLESGADPTYCNDEGCTPSELARQYGRTDLAELLKADS